MSFWFPFVLLAIIVVSAAIGIIGFILVCNAGRDTTPEPPEPPQLAPVERCGKGHPMTDENVYAYPSGRRVCRTCDRERRGRKAGNHAAV